MNSEPEPNLSDSATNKTLVVLVHGLGSHRVLMWPLAWQLRRHFETRTFGYRSFFGSIQQHANRLGQLLEKYDQDERYQTIHIVAHSMGNIVTRQAILNRAPKKLGRWVMLTAPNQGSPQATLLSRLLPFCTTVRQISDRPGSFVRQLPISQSIEIGTVTASHDRVVPEPSSHISAESDHIQIFSGHNGVLVRPTAAKQVISFLTSGRFRRTDATCD